MSDEDNKKINNLGGVSFTISDTSYDPYNKSLSIEASFLVKRNDLQYNDPTIVYSYDCENESDRIDIDVTIDKSGESKKLRSTSYFGSLSEYSLIPTKRLRGRGSFGTHTEYLIKLAKQLTSDGYFGSSSTGKIYKPINFRPVASFGSSLVGDIYIPKILKSDASFGISVSSNLVIPISLTSKGYFGVGTSVSLNIPKILSSKSYSGTSASYTLIVDKSIYIESYVGYSATYTITNAQKLKYNAEFGSLAEYNLSTKKTLVADASLGYTAKYDFNVPKLLNYSASFGISANCKLFVEPVPVIESHYGAYSTYKFYKYIEFSSDASYGFEASYKLRRKLVTFRANASYGSTAKYGKDPLYMEFISRLDCDIDTPKKYNNTDFDLEFDIFDTNLVNPLYWIKVVGNLSRKPVFANFSAGFGSTLNEVPKIKFTHGATFGSVGDSSMRNRRDPDTSFCLGNTVLNGQDVIFDFDLPDRECRFAIGAYQGSEARYDLTVQKTNAKIASFGTFTKFELYPYIKLSAKASFGTFTTFALTTDERFFVDVGYGATAFGKLRPKKIFAQYGAQATCKISMKYFLEYLEDGCLENEYIPVNPDGTVDGDNIRTQAIEGRRYMHTIKRRVYY